MILTIIMSFPLKFPFLPLPNYYKPFSIEGKTDLSEGRAGFFSKFLMGGGLKIFGPRRSPTGTKSDGGGTCEKNPTEAKTAHLMQN